LNSNLIQIKLKRLATRGVSQSNINAESLKSILIPVPRLQEQEQIVSVIRKTDEEVPILKNHLENLRNLKKRLLKNIFSVKKSEREKNV